MYLSHIYESKFFIVCQFFFFFSKTILEILQWRQIVLVQIRPDILLGLIWVQLFEKITSRQTLHVAGRE